MKYITIITIFLFSFIGWAEETEKNEMLPTMVMFNKDDHKVEVNNCEQYIKYSKNKYKVEERTDQIRIKIHYTDCSFVYGKDISDEEANEVLSIIHNAKLSIPLPEYMRGQTPKELELIIDKSKRSVDGDVLKSTYPNPEFPPAKPNYANITLKKKVSENLYSVLVIVDFSIGTYLSFNEYLFNTETKKYFLFYHPSILAMDFWENFSE